MTQPPQTPVRPALPPELDPRRTPPGPTPGRPHRTGRRRVARILSWIAVVTSAVVLIASTGTYLAWRYYNGRIARVETRIPGHAAPVAVDNGKTQNFLVVGSDTREAPGTQKFGAKKGSAKYVAGQRSDTVMLVHIPSGNAKATIVSFPRDSWVSIPSYTDPKTGVHTPAHDQRINSAFSLGGAPLLIEVVEKLSQLRVDHYLQVDFNGFQNMVNALDGVSICVKTTRNDKDSGDYLKAGTQHVNGKQALGFVRDRKGLPRGDLDRIADQQYFLSVLLHKVLSTGTLANPLRVNAFLKAATGSLTVDRDLSFSDMRTLALRMRHLDPGHVSLLTAPVKDASANINGADVVLLDNDKMRQLFDSLRGDKTTGTPAPSTQSVTLTVAPADVSVAVYNGAGTNGLASRTARDLRRVGFQVTTVGNRGSGAADTVVRYGAGRADSARTLAAAVPGARVVADASLGRVVQLVVGSDYSGARQVAVGVVAPTPAKSPAGSGTKGANATNAADAARSCAP